MKRKLNKPMIICSTINILFTLLFLFFCMRLGVVPVKYIIIIILVFILLNVLGLYLMKKKKKVYKGIGIGLSVLLVLLCTIGTYYLNETNAFLKKSFENKTNTYTHTYYVISKDKLNNYDKIYYYKETIDIEKAIDKLKENINKKVETDPYNDLYQLFTDLYNNKIEAVLIEKGLFEFMMESDSLFHFNNSNIIYSFDITVEEQIETVQSNGDSFSIYIGGADFTELYNDFNMIVTVNKKTGKILMTSTPRDFYVEVDGKSGMKDLLGYAGLWGINTSRKTLEKLYGITIDYYIKINTKSLVGLVDTLGGLEFCSDISYTSTHSTIMGSYDDTQGNKLYVKQGCHSYSGVEILTIARERKAYPDGDRQRQKNCQQIMINIFNKMVRAENLTNYTNILNAVSNLYTTNIPKELVTSLAKQTLDGTSWSIEQQSVTGRDSSGYVHLSNIKDYVMIPNQDSVNAASLKIKMIESGK